MCNVRVVGTGEERRRRSCWVIKQTRDKLKHVSEQTTGQRWTDLPGGVDACKSLGSHTDQLSSLPAPLLCPSPPPLSSPSSSSSSLSPSFSRPPPSFPPPPISFLFPSSVNFSRQSLRSGPPDTPARGQITARARRSHRSSSTQFHAR